MYLGDVLNASDDMDEEAIASALHEKGKDYASRGRWARAFGCYNKALIIQRKIYGMDHPAAGKTLNAIGVACTHLGETYAAVKALEEALWIRQNFLGDGHGDSIETANNLSILLKTQEAERNYWYAKKTDDS